MCGVVEFVIDRVLKINWALKNRGVNNNERNTIKKRWYVRNL